MASAHFTTCNCRGMLACLWATKVPPGTISSISILFQPIYRSTPCARVETAVRGRLTVGLRGHLLSRTVLRLSRVRFSYSGGLCGETVGAGFGLRGGAHG